MQEKIINELSIQKNSSSTDFQFWGIVLCLLLTSIFILASMTTHEGNMNDWVSNWQLASPNLNEIRAPQITLPFEISWNIYIILVIPFVLYYMDWVIVNSSRLSRYTSVLA